MVPKCRTRTVKDGRHQTFKGKGNKTMKLDAGLTPRQRMVLDIIDIRQNFGRKYNKGMLEAIRYAETLPEFAK